MLLTKVLQFSLKDDNSRGVSVMATIDSYITHVAAEILETRTGKKEFESTNLGTLTGFFSVGCTLLL